MELVTFKLTARAPMKKTPVRPADPKKRDLAKAQKGGRRVAFEDGATYPCRVFERALVPLDHLIEGPALIEEPSTVTLVGPRDTFRIDAHGFIRISFA